VNEMQVEPPHSDSALAGLKDFQLRTVDYAFRRLYLDVDKTARFLLADEVGLGKTLVARGIIALAIDYLRAKQDRVNVVYICSNSEIARQNVSRLSAGRDDFVRPSRITLLPTQVEGLKHNRVNFISLTPGTSFEPTRSLGRADERVLLYWLLKSEWRLKGNGPLNILQGTKSARSFRAEVKAFKDEARKIDASLRETFLRTLEDRIERERRTGKDDLRTRFRSLVRRFRYVRNRIPDDEKRERRDIVAELRTVLAASCVRALEPDLIILDEFQRFKSLLEPPKTSLEDEYDPSRLANELFEYTNPHSFLPARVLLISATPYKMYTVHDESEDHYQDLVQTISFLLKNEPKTIEFEQLMSDYRRELLHITDGNLAPLMQLKDQIEHTLRKVMVRTERLGINEDRGGMLAEIPADNVRLDPSDVVGYVALHNLGQIVKQPDTLEYWKSAPYLLNFMDNYRLKTEFDRTLNSPDGTDIANVLGSAEHALLLSSRDIERYRSIDPGNAKLRALFAETVDAELWKLLWLPPSMPYYKLGEPFASLAPSRVTKQLIFSRWRVVPRVIAALLSYEAERRMTMHSVRKPKNTTEARNRRGRLLTFALGAGRATGMPTLALIYPCITLALEFDPVTLRSKSSDSSLPEAAKAIDLIREKLAPLLENVVRKYAKRTERDEAWYWCMPFLLDAECHSSETRDWFSRTELSGRWSAADERTGQIDPTESRFGDHVQLAQKVISGDVSLGSPPSDLGDVIARMALAAPGVAVLRAVVRVTAGVDGAKAAEIRDASARAAHGFVSLFNLPEVTALIRGFEDGQPYWRNVLDYCVSGGLQAVLDEYAHVLVDMLGINNRLPAKAAGELCQAVRDALRLRSAVTRLDDIFVRSGRVRLRREPITMRSRFALRFSDEESEEPNQPTRSDNIRRAFNSPFWPFVLATTSIGHEGLDFHSYCHSVVHWNLPSNPVDLEQREGRVHRYKGHAVRKNLAKQHASDALNGEQTDPWLRLFAAGSRERRPGESDIVPFWVYPVDGGAKVERHVPALPLSRDSEHLRLLKKSLVMYRMVFGQAHQEDLVSFLEGVLPENKIQECVERLRIDLAPPIAL